MSSITKISSANVRKVFCIYLLEITCILNIFLTSWKELTRIVCVSTIQNVGKKKKKDVMRHAIYITNHL